jgi:signal peptidase I
MALMGLLITIALTAAQRSFWWLVPAQLIMFAVFLSILRSYQPVTAGRGLRVYLTSTVLGIAGSVVLTLAVVVPIRFFIASPFEMKGESMEPNFHTDELFVVDKISYRFQDPQRGDVVVLIPPTSEESQQYHVKRIIALPGEGVQFQNGKVVIFNDAHPEGMTLSESYIPDTRDFDTEGLFSEPVTIPANSYFTLGDNRKHSNDSRYWGVLPRWNIVGKASVVIWPQT